MVLVELMRLYTCMGCYHYGDDLCALPSLHLFVYDSGCRAAADPGLSWEIRSRADGNQVHDMHFQHETE